MPDIDIIFFDIDDTLMRKEDGYMPPQLPALMQSLKARGIITAIATGRCAAIIPQAIRELMQAGGIDILSSGNGQFATRNGEVLHEHPIPAADIAQILDFAKGKDWAYLVQNDKGLRVSRLDRRVMPAMFAITPWSVDPHAYRREAIHQFGLFINEAESAELIEAMRHMDLSDSYHYTPWHEFGCDLIPSAGSKVRGIREVCAALGIDIGKAAAFGDGLNDLGMLQHVGLGIAMGNACDELKAVADYVTSDIDQDGIANALRHFQLI